jgi:hypothetical protein
MLRNSYHLVGGSWSVVWMFLGSQTPSTRSETCKNQQGILAGNATHNNTSEEKLLFFRAKKFYNFFYEKYRFR